MDRTRSPGIFKLSSCFVCLLILISYSSVSTFAAAAAAAILDIFSQSFWKKTMTTTKIQLLMEEEEEKPNPGGGGGGGASTSTPPPDRISELPKEILHRILGFLEVDEFLIGTSLVSTKWRNLWKSVSTLNFTSRYRGSSRGTDDDDSVVDNGGGGGGGILRNNNAEKYQNFVDHVLRLRDSEASNIQIFRYYGDNSNSRGVGYDYLVRLHNFIVSAVVNQGAQEIQILEGFYTHYSNIHFDPSIFNSGLLRVFNFDITVLNLCGRIYFPRSMCCAEHLTRLSLNGIVLPEGDDDDESNAAQLHLVCPVLETLVMSCCHSAHLKVLDISAPRLKTLSICNFGMRRGHFDFLGGCRLEIRTPNLISLDYSGCVYVDCFTENLSRIADATLLISKETGMMEKTTSFVIKLLKGLSSTKSLTLWRFEVKNSFGVKALYSLVTTKGSPIVELSVAMGDPIGVFLSPIVDALVFSEDIFKEPLTPFTSLRTLKLSTSCKISSIQGMVHFLNSCSSVENLFWSGNEIRMVESDEHLMLPQCRLSHLKHVDIKRLHGHKNEIEFVKFLLKNSVVLEDIIIQTTADSPKQSIEENLKQFIKEEPSCRKSIKLEIL